MITSFEGNTYELFFSNQLAPLIALNYADELFFEHFETLCGDRYRILSIIRNGWQNKYGLSEDIERLTTAFEHKIDEPGWTGRILEQYLDRSGKVRALLEGIQKSAHRSCTNQELADVIMEVRKQSALLDAMSNMLHLFSSLVGGGFLTALAAYSHDVEKVNKNFVYYTQPIRESRHAKLLITDLPGRFVLNDHDANLSSVLRIGAFIKDDVSDLLDQRKDMMAGLFAEIAARLGCEVSDLEYLQIPELGTALDDKKYPEELVAKRKSLTVLVYRDRYLEVSEGSLAEEMLKAGNFAESNAADEAVSVLRGQPAGLGVARGKVVIAPTSAVAIDRMRDGDILVAPYTAVEYVPAMKRAAAIVTETGGITSHAAIVSRELGVPCVIGVKEAMKILKDGEMIEVNADAGEIRRLG